MPKIPTYQSDISARVRTDTPELVLRGDEWGTEARRAVATLATDIEKLQRDEDELHVTKTLADARSQFYDRLRKKSEEAKPGAENFTGELMGEYDAYVSKALEGTSSRYARKNLEAGLANIRTSIFQSATDFEAKARVEKKKDDVREIVNKIGNSLINAPHTFDAALQDAERAAEAAGLPPRETTALKKNVREGLSAIAVAEIIRQNPGGAIGQLKSGKWDDFLDPAKKSSLLDHANSEMRRRAAEGRMLQAAERGDTALDHKEYVAALKSGEDAVLPKRLEEENMKRAGFRPDQIRRINDEILVAKAVGASARLLAQGSREDINKVIQSAVDAAKPDGELGAYRGKQALMETLKLAKEADKRHVEQGSLVLRQAIHSAFSFKETLVEGDPQGQLVYVSQKPTQAEFVAKIAPHLGENSAMELYKIVEKAGTLTHDKLPALFENLEKSAKVSDVVQAANNFYRDEIEKREEGLKKQPADYVSKVRPEVKAAWSDYARIVGETKPGSLARDVAMQHALDVTIGAQREMLGIPPGADDARLRLPSSLTEDFLARLKAMSKNDPGAGVAALKQMETMIGRRNMPVFLTSLHKDEKTPPEIRVALLQNNPYGSTASDMMSLLTLDMEAVKKTGVREDADDIERAVGRKVAELNSTIPFTGDGVRTRNDIKDVSIKLTYKYMGEGKGLAEATELATKWIGEQYRFADANGAAVRIPVEVKNVSGWQMTRYIARFNGPLASVPGLSDEDQLKSVRAFGRFLSDPAGRGVYLTNRNGHVLNDKQGNQIFVSWEQLAAILPDPPTGEDGNKSLPPVQRGFNKKFLDAYDPRRTNPDLRLRVTPEPK